MSDAPPLPVELVSTRTADGVLLQGALAGPAGAAVGVLAVHGAWGNFYSSPPSALLRGGPARGLRVAALNLRAHDLGSLGDGEPCIGFVRHLMEDSALDLDAALALLLETGVERVLVVAHSYGSHQATHWLRERRPPAVAAAALASPAPPLWYAARWFVDGALEHYYTHAARAVAEGDPHRLLVLSSSAPVPMVVEAATMLNVWGPDTRALSHLHVAHLAVPLLITTGLREPPVYRGYAQEVAAEAGGAEVEPVDDDHYYASDRDRFAAIVLDWFERRVGAA